MSKYMMSLRICREGEKMDMKVKYVGIDGELAGIDSDVTIGKVYDVVSEEKDLAFSVELIDDVGQSQFFDWDVLEVVEEVKEMTKSDLVTGLHAVELRGGQFYIVVGKHLLSQRGWMPLCYYEDNLYLKKNECNSDYDYTKDSYDIVRVYKHRDDFDSQLGHGLSGLIKDDYELIWERQEDEDKQDVNSEELKKLKEDIERCRKRINEIERMLW